MCQALSVNADANELTTRFRIEKVVSHMSGLREVMPTEQLSIIFDDPYEGRLLGESRWGLMPFWAKDSILMESRTMLWKPSFDRIIKKQRCIIPCHGFFVSRTEGKETQRAKLMMRSGSFAIAGLYDVFRSPSGGGETRTCTLITTQANALVSPYQRQMPAILEEEHVEAWLNGTFDDMFQLHGMLRPMDPFQMVAASLLPVKGDKVPFEMPQPETAG
ncbi:SOS response-associated peptidase [Paenibacillus sp. GCM10027626]|uniref:SOS response-associated peptidase n=1 Tax=Paenibacillus sp. GCM10027626 TaxID=3273411 RepID=UPI00363C787A